MQTSLRAKQSRGQIPKPKHRLSDDTNLLVLRGLRVGVLLIPAAGVAVGPGRLMCIGGLCDCGRRQMGDACSSRCDLLPEMEGGGMDEEEGMKHRPFPVGVFQLLCRIPQLRRSRQPPQYVYPAPMLS